MKKSSTEPSKRDFLEGLPAESTAAELMARAKEAGISISPSYAYAFVAERKKKKGGKPGPKRGARRGRPPAAEVAARGNGGTRGGSPIDRQFLALALELGVRRSEELLQRLKANLGALTSA
jgi:hypothetical protein